MSKQKTLKKILIALFFFLPLTALFLLGWILTCTASNKQKSSTRVKTKAISHMKQRQHM